MTSVVLTHPVGDMDTWLGGASNRERVFAYFCTSHRIYRHAEADKVSIVAEGVDLEKMRATLSTPEADAAKAEDTVLEPIDLYVEVAGGK